MLPACSRCGRSLRNPVRWAGLVLGSTCAKAVGAAAAVKAHAQAGARRRRAAAVVDAGRAADPQQMELELA